MIHALAPRMPRGFSWVLLAIVAIAWAPSESRAQTTKDAPGDPKPGVEDKKSDDKADAADDAPSVEVFTDPNAKKALSIFAPLNFSGPPIKVDIPPDDRTAVQQIVSGSVNLDPEFLKRYVEFFAVELTKRENLNALLNPPDKLRPNDKASRALERAVDALTKPLIDARANENVEFLKIYTKILFDSSLSKILEGNYLTRIEAMIVLGMAGGNTPQQLDVYINQIKKPDQVIWVKLWAARGLTNATRVGKVDLDALKTNQAAEALIGFLNSDPKLPWPAQMRALEALGSLRVSTANLPRGKIDAASVAMRYLADHDARVEVRARAAWALGMMKISPSLAPFNFPLIAAEIGQLTADLGQDIVQEFDANEANFEKEKVQVEHLTALLLFQVYPALIGEDGVRDSGLIHSPHPNFAGSKDLLTKMDGLVKGMTRDAYELLRAPGGSLKGKRNDLDAKVAGLKQFLEQTAPKDRHLVPGGPEFVPSAADQVAGSAGR